MKTIEYWEVTECYDRVVNHIANFANEDNALELVGKNLYRGASKKTLTIFDSVGDYENNTREKLRERALAKLTVEERNALGFK